MFKVQFGTAMVAVFLTMLVLSPLAWMARRSFPPPIATVDLQRLIEEEQKKAVEALAKGSTGPEQRAALDKRSLDFAKRLSASIDGLGQDCNCIIVNKAALLGGAAIDYTEQVRDRMRR